MRKTEAIAVLAKMNILVCYHQQRVAIVRPRGFDTHLIEIVPPQHTRDDVARLCEALACLSRHAVADDERRQERNLRRRIANRARLRLRKAKP